MTVLTRSARLETQELSPQLLELGGADAAQPVRLQQQAALVPTHRGTATNPPPDIVDQWGLHSFPASDPPANW